ncbi:ribose-phosphate pyrophosphokinase [Microlunatus endophyticus]|uniref:ribose-phosphate diphosphokinase n=1 Tax=Microlunatus endophyticus TaxID=1716077 RepID=A0A917W1W9_9ACTN|nr:ribose-phosphate diphosphokinase [Microlunatus endophyticus]GGL58148.1 ribose-phosphate pyrophosphokinase [Microlunatus endophyticus]
MLSDGVDSDRALRDITVFTGSAHPEFAQEMCDILGIELSPSRTTRFSNDCLQVQLRSNCRQRDVFIVQPLVPPVQEHLVELCLMLDAARGASAAHITAVIPHYAYARSDKKDAPRISIGGRLVADMIATAGATRVVTMALHAPQVHGFFSIPVDHLNAVHELAEHFKQRDLTNTVIVSPDLGNAKVATQLARKLDLTVAAGNKRRLADDKVVIESIVGDVQDKNVIVFDDEIATAASTVELLRLVRSQGARRISLACTHGLFTGPAIERLGAEADIDEIVITNTVPLAPEKRLPNISVRSVAPLFAEAVRRITSGQSVSSLFSDEPTYG